MSHVFNPDSYVGKRVLVMLSKFQADEIRTKRLARGLAAGNGNDPQDGSVYPGIIVADFMQPRFEREGDAGYALRRKTAPVNIQVFLDGTDSYWLLSSSQFDPETHVSMIQPEKASDGTENPHGGKRINVYVHGQQPISYWLEAGYTDPEHDARGHWIIAE